MSIQSPIGFVNEPTTKPYQITAGTGALVSALRANKCFFVSTEERAKLSYFIARPPRVYAISGEEALADGRETLPLRIHIILQSFKSTKSLRFSLQDSIFQI